MAKQPEISQEINTTIMVNYDDVTRMKDFCCEKEGGVSRDFMDWYIKESTFSVKKGVLMVENIFKGITERFTVAFDFTNADLPSFILYDKNSAKQAARFTFQREQNMTMTHIDVKIKWFDKLAFREKSYDIFFEGVDFGTEGLEKKTQKKLRAGMSTKSKSIVSKAKKEIKVLEEKLNTVYWQICNIVCKQAVYFVYSTMYYFARTDQKQISKAKEQELVDSGMMTQIKTIYKYSGYVNIDEQRVYKPVIKKDPNEPAREYGRHIEKWMVRGHYRTINGKQVWVEAHERGEGKLETRVYGTEKESELNLEPKVFEVTRNVKVAEKQEEPVITPKEEKAPVPEKIPDLPAVIPPKGRRQSVRVMFRMIFRKLFKTKKP